ncbi:MAG: hypothetical protein QM779_07945 [Propionicimonas sp.]|uniref:hypothetical protein n=1 Tax=Propionicimonas sp. TaxID=1955623 RepID=UPI003D0D2A9A
MRTSLVVLRRAAAVVALAATLVFGTAAAPAQAASKGECTIKVKTVTNGSIGGTSASWTCNKATSVTVTLEAGVYISGHYYSRTKTLSYASLNATKSYELPIAIDGVQELDSFGRVCFQWTSNTRKCVERSDSLSFAG